MRFESYIFAGLLQCLEQRVEVLRSQVMDVAMALSRDQFVAALKATKELNATLEVIVSTRARLEGGIAGIAQ